MPIEIKLIDNSEAFLSALKEASEAALEAVGQQAVSHAKQELSNSPQRIDTGMLRNSITYALGGKGPAISGYSGDKGNSGGYAGTAQADGQGYTSVYVGTNVEYARYVHEGTRHMAPNRFIKNAVQGNVAEFQALVKKYLENA